MKKVKLLSLILVAVLASLAFVGCTSSDANDTPSNVQEENQNESKSLLKGTINIIGSTSVQPLTQKLADVFASVEPGIQIDIQGVGSTAGVKAANDGTADIGTASRELKSEEKEWGLTEHVIARDGIAIAVNPSNSVSDLTTEQAAKIFKGEITNWKEVGGEDREIIVISREAGSGTRGAFDEILGIKETLSEKALVAEGNGAVKQNIATKQAAIGYVSLGYIDDSIKALKIDGVEPTVETIQANEYPVARPFLMLTKGELSPEVKAFIDFIMSSEGQKIVGEGYIPVK
ncbi:Phosphate-binding protein pstS 1 PBP 1 [Proteiniborus sp. DW1]|uniref:phosphate ABC transporter substrate-binding protein n=1 Tax=Proteiniborus sp. DW1 TaxID=1889883 RepID=UPI00092E0EE4|nr:Phosphate-binding protein pstS 1 PBP 1 [Proteiniborus sp. DW1]